MQKCWIRDRVSEVKEALIHFLIIITNKMVKGFDTTISDPSKQFLDYLLTFLDSNKETITP